MSSKPRRRNTYVIDKVSEDNHREKDKVGSSSLGGIKALLDKANKGHFPAEVKAYINSHFWMIREENLQLNQHLDKANLQLQQYKSQVKDLKEVGEDLKAVKSQLEREKAKNKALMKKYNNNNNNNQDVIWMQTTNLDQQMPEIRPQTTTLTSNNNEDKKIKMLNKTMKSLRAEVANLQADKSKLTKVSLLKLVVSSL